MKKKPTSNRSQIDRTDYDRLSAMKDEDIDLSDIPRVTAETFARGIVRRNLEPIPRKKRLTLRIDSDVVDWYKNQGRGYQTRINSLLRAYMKEHQRHTSRAANARQSKSI
jgi:uncharacterized protein (DUF4415 family)